MSSTHNKELLKLIRGREKNQTVSEWIAKVEGKALAAGLDLEKKDDMILLEAWRKDLPMPYMY
jgi:hypothetical protein